MAKLSNLIGKKIFKLHFIKRLGNNKHKKARWLCKCDCGNYVSVIGSDVVSGKTKSCGCIKKNGKHLMTKTRPYRIWYNLKYRCSNKNIKSYRIYGGRGIKVCSEWEKDFKSFYNWAIKNGYRDNLTIDRIDVNGDYCPENCRWVTQKEQQRNKRTNHIIELNGEKHCMAEWCEILNFKKGVLVYRINKAKMKPEEALSKPLYFKRKRR